MQEQTGLLDNIKTVQTSFSQAYWRPTNRFSASTLEKDYNVMKRRAFCLFKKFYLRNCQSRLLRKIIVKTTEMIIRGEIKHKEDQHMHVGEITGTPSNTPIVSDSSTSIRVVAATLLTCTLYIL